MPDWSWSYRQGGNSGQLSEIAEAHSDDAFRGNTLADIRNKSNPFEANYYSSSTRSRLARRQISKEIADIKERRINLDDNDENNFINPRMPESFGQALPESIKQSQVEKAQSFSKPILPPLNIARVRDENQNILPIKGFQEVTRNKSSRSPHLSSGFSRVRVIGEFNFSVGDWDGSFIKEDTIWRDDISSTQKLRTLARRLGESYFAKDLPVLTKLIRKEKEFSSFVKPQLHHEFTFKKMKTEKFNRQSSKVEELENSLHCWWRNEIKYLVLKKLNEIREEK